MNEPTTYHSTAQAARILHVSAATLQRWMREGRIHPDSRTAGGHARWTDEQIQSLRAQLAEGSQPSLPSIRDPRVDAISETVIGLSSFVRTNGLLLALTAVCLLVAFIAGGMASRYQVPVYDDADPGYSPTFSSHELRTLTLLTDIQFVSRLLGIAILLGVTLRSVIVTYRRQVVAYLGARRKTIIAVGTLLVLSLAANILSEALRYNELLAAAGDLLLALAAALAAWILLDKPLRHLVRRRA
jgi:hypothetical protein